MAMECKQKNMQTTTTSPIHHEHVPLDMIHLLIIGAQDHIPPPQKKEFGRPPGVAIAPVPPL